MMIIVRESAGFLDVMYVESIFHYDGDDEYYNIVFSLSNPAIFRYESFDIRCWLFQIGDPFM